MATLRGVKGAAKIGSARNIVKRSSCVIKLGHALGERRVSLGEGSWLSSAPGFVLCQKVVTFHCTVEPLHGPRVSAGLGSGLLERMMDVPGEGHSVSDVWMCLSTPGGKGSWGLWL